MNWALPPNLKSAQLLRRYKRFLADVVFDNGEVHTVHCPNPGRMTTCMAENCRVWLSESTNPKRKLKWTWELAEIGGSTVLINTQRTNAIVRVALERGVIADLVKYEHILPEQRVCDGVRADFLLQDAARQARCWVEAKNVTYQLADRTVAFPDAVTVRGVKQLSALTNQAKLGHHVAIVYLIGRTHCDRVVTAVDIDPAYARAASAARKAGVSFYALRTELAPDKAFVPGLGQVSWN